MMGTPRRFGDLAYNICTRPHEWRAGAVENVFSTRVGPNYAQHKSKAASGPTYYAPLSLDAFRTPSKVSRGLCAESESWIA